MFIKNYKKIFVTIIIFIFLIIIILIYFYPKTKITIRGILIDALTNQPIKELVVIKVEDKVYEIKNGIFQIKDVSRYGLMEISGAGLFSPIKVNINNRKYIEIVINRDLSILLEKFIRDITFRKFRQNYEFIHPDIKLKIGEDEFLKKFNQWFDIQRKKGFNIKNIDFAFSGNSDKEVYSTITFKKYNSCEEIMLKWNIEKDGSIFYKETKTYFCKENNQWFWIYNEEVLF